MLRTILKLLWLPLLGLLFFAVPTVMVFQRLTQPDLVRLEAPGRATFKVIEPDTYTVFRQVTGVSASHDEFISEKPVLPAGLRISILDVNDQTTVTIRENPGTTSRNGTLEKHSLISADLLAGTYELVADSSQERVTLVVGKSAGSLRGFLMVMLCYLAGGLCLTLGIIYGLVVFIRYLANNSTVVKPQL